MQNIAIARHLLLTLGLIFATSLHSFSQDINSTSTIDKALLLAFQKLKEKPIIVTATLCTTNKNWTIDETLAQATNFNINGNWKCCETLLAALYYKADQLKPIEKLHVWLGKADYFNSHQAFDSAEIFATFANQEATTKKWLPEKTKALLALSFGASKRRNIASAYVWADSALQLSRKINDKWLEAKALLQMALCARRHFTSAAHRAFPYYLQAIDIAELIGDPLTLFTANMYFADDHVEIGQWPEALPHLEKAVELAIKTDAVYQAYTAYIGVGYALEKQGYTKQALTLYKKALDVSQAQKFPYGTQIAYTFISGIFQNLKQYDSALLYVNLGAALPGIDSFWANTWEQKASIYQQSGNYKMATEMFVKAMDWANEDFLYRNQNQLSSYEAKLKTTEKELQVVQEKKRSIQLEWMIGGVVILLFMAAWAYILQRRARHKLFMQNAIIKKQQFDLEKSLSEKEMLLKEIHHRVKNNLSVISSLLELQSSGIDNETAKAAIAEGQNRVNAIALIHQRLYQHENLSAIEFGSFVENMIPQVAGIFKKPRQQLKTTIQVPETLLDIDTAVPLGLILNELLTNSFKYAFSNSVEGHVCIKLITPKAGNYVLTYVDDGPGIPVDFDLKKSKSLGLRLIYRLSNQIGGSAEYTLNGGAMFVIKFKDAVTRNKDA